MTAMHAIGQAATSHAETSRVQAEAQVQLARINAEADKHRVTTNAELEHRQLRAAFWFAGAGLVFIAGLVAASFAVGKYEIATHAVGIVCGAVAGWLARGKR